MSTFVYHFEIKDILDVFHKDIVTVTSHNYRIEEILRMVINSYKNDNTIDMQFIGRFCIHYAEDGTNPAIDSHIMLQAILNLRHNLFRVLDNFTIVNMRQETNQFPWTLRYKSLVLDHLLIEVECQDYANGSL